jgi:hypothetical protein
MKILSLYNENFLNIVCLKSICEININSIRNTLFLFKILKINSIYRFGYIKKPEFICLFVLFFVSLH